jgi:uncharacterized protein
MSETPVIDVCGSGLGRDGWRASLGGLRAHAPDFLTSFGGGLARAAGLSRPEAKALLAGDPEHTLDVLAERLGVDADVHAQALRDSGVRREVLHGGWHPLPGGEGNLNDHVLERAARHPDVLEAWCGVDPREQDAALAELTRCAARGVRGVTLLPFLTGTHAESPACHAIYAHAAAARLPVWLHCGFNAARAVAMTTPDQLDRIAAAHPELRLLAGHGGWPWVPELIAVMMRQPNVYLDTSAHNPAGMASPGSGWEPLLHHLPGLLRGRVVFGSASVVHGVPARDFADGVLALGLPAALAGAWLHDNAARLLGLDNEPREESV